jgi:hypothetical protein
LNYVPCIFYLLPKGDNALKISFHFQRRFLSVAAHEYSKSRSLTHTRASPPASATHPAKKAAATPGYVAKPRIHEAHRPQKPENTFFLTKT